MVSRQSKRRCRYITATMPQVCEVQSEYDEREGRIYPGGDSLRLFDPLQDKIGLNAIGELAKVNSGAISPLDFVRQYGLLGYQRLAMRQFSDSRTAEKTIRAEIKKQANTSVAVTTAFDRIRQKHKTFEGEPVEWIKAHARTVDAALVLIEALEDGNKRHIANVL